MRGVLPGTCRWRGNRSLGCLEQCPQCPRSHLRSGYGTRHAGRMTNIHPFTDEEVDPVGDSPATSGEANAEERLRQYANLAIEIAIRLLQEEEVRARLELLEDWARRWAEPMWQIEIQRRKRGSHRSGPDR